MLNVENIVKHFNNIKAVDNVSFSLKPSSLLGLLGRNGAGKTTTLRMLVNILKPDSGTILLDGVSVNTDLLKNIGYLPEDRGLYPKAKVHDTLIYFARLKGLSKVNAETQAQLWLKTFELSDSGNLKVAELSKGNYQKIQFIIAILNEPDILILDEPFTGLDPHNVLLLKSILKGYTDKGKSVLLSTHQMDQVEKICSDICLLHKGKVISYSPIQELKKQFISQKINIEFDTPPNSISELYLDDQSYINGILTGSLPENTLSGEIIQRIGSNYPIRQFKRQDLSLEDIFIRLTGSKND